MRLSIVLPCFNEAENIERTLDALQTWFCASNIDGEIIVVDDGSKDATPIILDTLAKTMQNLIVVHHEVNKGYGAAVLTGCDRATGDIIGFMDSDGQFDPKDFDKLLPLLSTYSYVTGRRRNRADPFVRKMNAKLFGILSFLILDIWVRDINCAMKLWQREIWQTIRPRVATGALVNAEMFYRLKRAGLSYGQVDVSHYPRKFGMQTGAKLSVIFRMFKELCMLRLAGR